MTWKELSNVITAIEDKSKTSYEQTRMLMHSIYQVNSTKSLKATDVIKFSWDMEEEINTHNLLNKDDATNIVEMVSKADSKPINQK